MKAAKKLNFNLSPDLSDKAQRVHTYNNLNTGTLVSVGTLANDDFDTVISKHTVFIFKNERLSSKANANIPTACRTSPLRPPSRHQKNLHQ